MSIRKKVANLWAPLLQSKGNSTTQPMSQKAVSDELNQLKSDLDNKINTSDSLSYEEITANNIDLTGKVASAIALRDGVLKFVKKEKDIDLASGNHVITLDIPSNITPLAIVPIGIGADAVWPSKLIIWDTSPTSISFYVESSNIQNYQIR